MTSTLSIVLSVNGTVVSSQVEARRSLADFLRLDLGLTGTHLGCEHGVCGACTVQVDGTAVRSCLMLAVQAHGKSVRTVEGLATGRELHPLQQAFRECHALQCGFCTSGVLMTLEEFLREQPSPCEQDIREALSGNICRCTGYQGIVDAVLLAAGQMQTEGVWWLRDGSAPGSSARKILRFCRAEGAMSMIFRCAACCMPLSSAPPLPTRE